MTLENQHLVAGEPKGEPIENLKTLFKKEGLNFISVPEKFSSKLRKVSTFLYSTKNDEAPDPYDLKWFLNEVQSKDVDDYLVVGNTGHGVNNWAMHIYFVDGPFVCFLQQRWGGALNNPDIAKETFNKALVAIERLRQSLAKSLEENKIEPNKRLVLVESDFIGNQWAWMQKGQGIAEDSWDRDEPSFLHAWNSIPR